MHKNRNFLCGAPLRTSHSADLRNRACFGVPRTGVTAILLRLRATIKLVVADLFPQHDPTPSHKLPGASDSVLPQDISGLVFGDGSDT